ncbi:hypothetical protein [Cytobacillus purgationiresistens]|uniref:Uncharacterized protein n=1 Tax=Cytobacillus purgationiresistens TaxID=863449 RepID=A0ABU0AE48_9BACI|nr:hypothetical protein [Cytobacillus purgationiresistens]MDQ0269016.1 hypothetical protein [Cytobacillus purgationiresistens]
MTVMNNKDKVSRLIEYLTILERLYNRDKRPLITLHSDFSIRIAKSISLTMQEIELLLFEQEKGEEFKKILKVDPNILSEEVLKELLKIIIKLIEVKDDFE